MLSKNAKNDRVLLNKFAILADIKMGMATEFEMIPNRQIMKMPTKSM